MWQRAQRLAFSIGLALLTSGCVLMNIPPTFEPMDERWNEWMLAGHYGYWKDGREEPWPWRPTEGDKIQSYAEGAEFTRYRVRVIEEHFGGFSGWWVGGGLVSRAEAAGRTLDLFLKRIARVRNGGIVEGQDISYECLLVVRDGGRGRLVKKWLFAPTELALAGDPVDPSIFGRSTRTPAEIERILRPIPGERRWHFVDAYLHFDPPTMVATVSVTGLRRPFEERVDLSSELPR